MKTESIERMVDLSVDPRRMREAEEMALGISGEKEEILALLGLLEKRRDNREIICAIFLKISIGKSKEISRLFAEEIFNRVREVSYVCNDRTFSILCESVVQISRCLSWKSIRNTIVIEKPFLEKKHVRSLNLINAYFIRYRTESRSDALYQDIIDSADEMGSILLSILVETDQTKKSVPGMYKAVFEMMYSLIYQDIPYYIENNLDDFLWKCISNVDYSVEEEVILMIRIFNIALERYLDAVKDYSMFLDCAFEMLNKIDKEDENAQSMCLEYFLSVLEEPSMEICVFKSKEFILPILIGRVSYAGKETDDLAYSRSFFAPDVNVQRENICRMVKGMVEKTGINIHTVIESLSAQSYSDLFFFGLYLGRDKSIKYIKEVLYITEHAYKYIQKCSFPHEEKDVEALLSASSLIFFSVFFSRISLDKDFVLKVSDLICESKAQPKLVFVLCRLIGLLLEKMPEKSFSENAFGERLGLFLVQALQALSPNEFIAYALFQTLRTSSIQMHSFVQASRERLLSTMESAGNLLEAKGLWDILILGALHSKEYGLVCIEIAKESLEKDIAEWFGFALQALSICALLIDTKAFPSEYLHNIISAKEIWEAKELYASLIFCVISLIYRDSAIYRPFVLDLVQFLSDRDEKSLFILTRYLPAKEMIYLIEKTDKYTPAMYLGCLRACMDKEDKIYQLEKALVSLLQRPFIYEQDTYFFIDSLQRIKERPFSFKYHSEIDNLLKKLRKRDCTTKEDPCTLFTADRVFSSFSA